MIPNEEIILSIVHFQLWMDMNACQPFEVIMKNNTNPNTCMFKVYHIMLIKFNGFIEYARFCQ